MKSKNNLTITGVVVDVYQMPNSTATRFTLIHNFGGRKQSLFLHCIAYEPIRLEKGDMVCLSAYLRMGLLGVEIVVKKVLTNQSEEI